MALLRRLVYRPGAGSGPRTAAEGAYSILTVDGRHLLHIETYGSADRQIPGKVSQAIDLDVDGAQELLKAIRHAFPGLESLDTK